MNAIKLRGKRNLGILGICLLLSAAVSLWYYHILQQQAKLDIERLTTIYATRTESVINTVFHKTDILAAVVKLNNGQLTEPAFNTIAQLVYKKNSGIRGIQYMPAAVVTYSFPIEGNEGVIGKDFFKIPERQKDIWLAINTKSIALSGPYNLIQGGLGVVARNPIFLTNAGGQEYFQGFSAIILDLPEALDEVEFGNLREEGYDFQLFCINENNERLVIAGNKNLAVEQAFCTPIQVPHHTWTLALRSLQPFLNTAKSGGVFLAGMVLSVIIWLLLGAILQRAAAVQAKDKFFSDISHDMRTPLNAVIGFSALARKQDLSVEQKDAYLAKIQDAGKLLLDLINDTLTVSKAGSGKLFLHLQPVATSQLTSSILEPIRALAEEKHITLILEEKYRPRIILADWLNLHKIYMNLLNNAVKFTPEGGHIRVTLSDTEAGALVVKIQDDGIGISQEFLPHLFEPFAQEQRKGYEGVGTGLGLAIVKQLVDLMQGTIKVESRQDKGTIFTVQLPFKEVSLPATTPPVSRVQENLSVLQGKKILLCEDNTINREIAVTLLKRQGMVTVEAVNGQEGINKFTASAVGEYAAILMDLRMPTLDGYEAANAIRDLPRADAQSIPIIAMTADVFASDVDRCRAAGMNSHVGKPIEPGLLYHTLAQLIKK